MNLFQKYAEEKKLTKTHNFYTLLQDEECIFGVYRSFTFQNETIAHLMISDEDEDNSDSCALKINHKGEYEILLMGINFSDFYAFSADYYMYINGQSLFVNKDGVSTIYEIPSEKGYEFFGKIVLVQDHKVALVGQESIVIFDGASLRPFKIELNPEYENDITDAFFLSEHQATLGGGESIYFFNGQEFTRHSYSFDVIDDSISCVSMGKSGEILIGCEDEVALTFQDNKFTPIATDEDTDGMLNIFHFNQSEYWVANSGLFIRENGELRKISSLDEDYAFYSGSVSEHSLTLSSQYSLLIFDGTKWKGILFDHQDIDNFITLFTPEI